MEQDVLDISRRSGARLEVQRLPVPVQAAEGLLVACKRSIGRAGTAPRLLDIDLDPDVQRATREHVPRPLRHHCAPAERDHERVLVRQHLSGKLLLDAPELGLAALVEDLCDRAMPLLDLLVEIDELTLREASNLPSNCRLARPHEADEGDVLAKSGYVLADHGIRST
jgi:hypothetical protein